MPHWLGAIRINDNDHDNEVSNFAVLYFCFLVFFHIRNRFVRNCLLIYDTEWCAKEKHGDWLCPIQRL